MLNSTELEVVNDHKYKQYEVIQYFSDSYKPRMLFFLLINVGILIFMSRRNEKSFITSGSGYLSRSRSRYITLKQHCKRLFQHVPSWLLSIIMAIHQEPQFYTYMRTSSIIRWSVSTSTPNRNQLFPFIRGVWSPA